MIRKFLENLGWISEEKKSKNYSEKSKPSNVSSLEKKLEQPKISIQPSEIKRPHKTTKWDKVHVFISSTFNDMHAERDYLVKQVFPELSEWCERSKLRLVDIDLRWGVTEQDALYKKNVVKVCLDRIDECRPFFLCFLGQRRGWVPNKDEISPETYQLFPALEKYSGTTSVTEMEILHALINPLHQGKLDSTKSPEYYERVKYAFFYLRDSSYLSELPENPPLLRETYTNEGIKDKEERAAHETELQKWREEIIPKSGRPMHSYLAKWNYKAFTPELNIPLQCPSGEPLNIERWRNQWAKAGVVVSSNNIEDRKDEFEKAKEFNKKLCKGRLTDFNFEKYLFSWEQIPGKNSEEFTDFLKSNYAVDWIKKAKIVKTDNSKTIIITFGNKSLSLDLNNKNTELNLIIDNVQTDKFIVKAENGKLNIYFATPLSTVILQDLKEAITARYPDHKEVSGETDLQKEIDQQEQFQFLNSEGFIEREGDFSELDKYVKGDSNKLFVLTAPGGMGKSMLLANWIDHYRLHIEGRKEKSIHFRFIGASDRSTTVYSLMRFLLLEMKEIAHKFDEEVPEDPTKLREVWQKLLEATGKQGKTVIVIDAINQLESRLSDLNWLPFQLPPNIKLIVSFKRGEQAAEELYNRFKNSSQVIFEVKPFENIKDKQELIKAYLSQYLKDLDQQHIDTLINSPGAINPLYLKVVLSELRVFGAFSNLDEKIRKDFGETPVSAFQGVLKRLEDDPAYSLIEPKKAVSVLFGLMAHARHGLSAEELTKLFIQALDMEDSKEQRKNAAETVHLFLRQVRPFLARREGRYDFFYESFKNAVEERYVAKSIEEGLPKRLSKDWHRLLAEYFGSLPTWQEITSNIDKTFGRQPNVRKVAELPYHQIYGEIWSELETTLCDLEFVEAKCIAGMPFDLLNDCDMAIGLKSMPTIIQIQKAISLSMSGILDRPQLTMQLVFNRLMFFTQLESKLVNWTKKAQCYLDQQPFWICAEAPLPGSQTSSILFIPFEINSTIQSLSFEKASITVASPSGDVKIYSLFNRHQIINRKLHASSIIVAIAFNEKPLSLAYIDQEGLIYSDNNKYISGRKGEHLLLIHPIHGIIAVRSDGSLVCWNQESNEVSEIASNLPPPLKVLRFSNGGRSILFVAGNQNQTIGISTWNGNTWISRLIPYKDLPIVDACIDPEDGNIFIVTIDRSISILDIDGKCSNQLFYERYGIRGAPIKCVIGIGSSKGCAFFATDSGQIAGWDWHKNKTELFESYRSLKEHSFLSLMEVLTTGDLFITTEQNGKKISHITQSDTISQIEPISTCLLTKGKKIVLASNMDHTVKYFSLKGLLVNGVQEIRFPTAIAQGMKPDSVWIGNREGKFVELDSNGPLRKKALLDYGEPVLGEPVVSLFYREEEQSLIVAGINGSVEKYNLIKRNREVLWHSTGYEKQIKILPAGNHGLYWSLRHDEKLGKGKFISVISLIQGVDQEKVISTGFDIYDMAASKNGYTIAIIGSNVQVFRSKGSKWDCVFKRITPMGLKRLCFMNDDFFIAAILDKWLEVWQVSIGLPTIAAIDLPKEVTCLDANENCIIAGCETGDLMSLNLKGKGVKI